MKSKQLLILGIVLAVLVLVVVAVKAVRSGPRTGIEEARLVEDFELAYAGYIEFFHGAKPARKVVLAKKGEVWIAPSKFGARADEKRITSLLGDLQGLAGETRAEDPSLFGEFGITDEQAIHLVVRDTGGSEITHLLIGKGGTSWRNTFVRRAGSSKVVLADAGLLSRLGISRPEKGDMTGIENELWLDLALLPGLDVAKIAAFELRSPGAELTFERGGAPKENTKVSEATEWKVATAHVPYKADNKGIGDLLNSLASRRADDVASPDREEHYGFKEEECVATLTFDEGSVKKIVVGGRLENDDQGRRYLKVVDPGDTSPGAGLPYIVAKYVVERLFEDTGKLLDLKVIELPGKELKSVTLTGPQKNIVIERDGGGRWRLTQPQLGFKERKDAARQLGEKYADFKPDDLLNRKKISDFKDPEYTAVLSLTNGTTRRIEVSREIENTLGIRQVKVNGVEMLFSIGRSSFRQLFPSLERLLEVKLAAFDRKKVDTIRLSRGGREITLRRDADNEQEWKLEIFGFTFDADKGKVEEILKYFTSIVPLDVLGKVELSQYGLDKPALSVTVGDGEKTATIIVGKKEAAACYGAHKESNLVFTMVDRALDTANVKLSQLANLRVFPAGDVPDSLAVRRGGKMFQAERKESEKDGKKVQEWLTPQGDKLDMDLMTKLVMKVMAVKADDILGPADDGKFGFREDGDFIDLGIKGEQYRLTLGELSEKDKARYTRLDGREGVLLIKEAVLAPALDEAAKLLEKAPQEK